MPLPIRTLMIAALTAVAVLVVLPPVGSTDALDYAVYGHIAALGHSPYVMTPRQYSLVYHVAHGVPADWARDPSYYGPLATAEQVIAAKLAGASLARTVFWLKLWNAIAFAAVALTADRMFRADRASRLRAHLLWTVNPLLIWSLIAAAHLDVLAAAVGVAGLLIIDRRAGGRRPWLAAAAAGLCVGAAADIKVDYLLFVLAIGWALRPAVRAALALSLAAAVAAPVRLVQRDNHLRARLLPGVPAGLDRRGLAQRDHHRRHARPGDREERHPEPRAGRHPVPEP